MLFFLGGGHMNFALGLGGHMNFASGLGGHKNFTRRKSGSEPPRQMENERSLINIKFK